MWDAVDHYYDNGSGLPENSFTPGHRYIYRACGFASDEYGPWSPEYTVTIPPFLPPENVEVELLSVTLGEGDSYDVRVRITWDPVEVNGVMYTVYEEESLEGHYRALVYETQNTVVEYEFDVDIEDPPNPVSHYFKVKSIHQDYGATDYSETVWVDICVDEGGSGGSASWEALGSDGFGNTENNLVSATVGSTLYVGFEDSNNSDRIKVMRHNGSESGSWSDVGGYLSVSAAEWDEISLVEQGGSLYAGYADTGVSSGGSSEIFVQKLDGTSWTDLDVSVYGHTPALAGDSDKLYMVYPTGTWLGSKYYNTNDATWYDYDSDYWFDTQVSSTMIALDCDNSGHPVLAAGAGSAAVEGYAGFDFYRYNGGWAQHLSTFTPGSGSTLLELHGFCHDGSGTPYLAYSNRNSTGTVQESCGLAKWTGSSWQEIDLLAEIGSIDGMVGDLSIIPAASDSGVLVAAGYYDNTESFVQLWHYDGSEWQPIGQAIDAEISASCPELTVSVQYDDDTQPVIIFADDETGSIKARVFQE